MEMHHKLRRDPTWHKDGCNLCGMLGHQASQCSSGTVNWRQVYTDDAFILRPARYWSEEQAAKKARLVNVSAVEKAAAQFAETQAKANGLDWHDIQEKAALLKSQDPSFTVPKQAAVEQTSDDLPEGWASAQDPQGRTYYYEKKTMKTQWDKPTASAEVE